MTTPKPSHRIEQLTEFVQAQHRRSAAEQEWHPVFTADYRWEHTQRVAHYGHLIAVGEGLDTEICVAGCLLHDIAYFFCGEEEDWRNHGRLGAKISRPVLKEAGFSAEETAAICHSIAVHVDGKTDVPHPQTPIADVVSDADNVDRFSAYRVVLRCMEHEDFGTMADSLRDRVKGLLTYRKQNPLETKTGQALFAKQLDLQIAFFRAIISDAEITRLPSI